MFDPVDDPAQNNVAWFLMGTFCSLIFLRERKTVLPHFVFFPDNSEILATP